MERVGFIGLGNMGYPMAENMLATFGNLTVYNRSQKKAEILQMKGAKIAHSPMEVADSSHVISLSLPWKKLWQDQPGFFPLEEQA